MQTAKRQIGIDSSRQSAIRRAQYVVVAAFAVQTVHLIEHFAQTWYWFLHPGDAAWLTPWAVAARDLLVVGNRIVTGNEFLHLIANSIFLVALLVMAWVATAHKIPVSRYPHLGKAISVQSIQVAEHLLLSITVFLIGKPLGVSTLFGFATGAWGSTYGIWFHFVLNGIATYYAALALAEMHQDDLVIPVARPRPRSAATST
jgi:hypothetical protein